VHGAEYLSTNPPPNRKNNIKVSHKNGKKAYWRKCGSFGHLACFSFYANKNVTTGEGGMVLTSDKKYEKRLRDHRNLCFLKTPRFLHDELGHNYRLTNVQAAIGLAQIERLNKTIARKIYMAKRYSSHLEALPLRLPTERKWSKNVIWMYGVTLLEEKRSQKYFEKNWNKLSLKDYKKWPTYRIMNKLLKAGIDTRPFFVGIHEQPALRKMRLFKNASYPVTERIARSGFYLPSGQAIKDREIKEVCSALRGMFK